MDGSSVDVSHSSGGGFLLRDCAGVVLHAQSDFYGPGTSFYAEATCLLRGLQVCATLGFTSVLVESDSQVLVDMVHKNATWPWRHCSVLTHILMFMQATNSSLVHIFREANSAADWLAVGCAPDKTSAKDIILTIRIK